ncbi:MAG: cytochrome c [Alphaproteobacteria bacterium]|nr:cytochrome c [Alphaproteobacteria bacterium]
MIKDGFLTACRMVGLGLVFALLGAPALADELDFGHRLYIQNCASCHGIGGKGDGPLEDYLTLKPANLTVLAKKNVGVFPFAKVFRIIDGRRAIRGHGEKKMPVWGSQFRTDQSSPVDPSRVDDFIFGRISALTFYLASIQE